MTSRRSNTIKKGDLVAWDDKTCRVLLRRRVSGMAVFQTSDFEVLLETLNGEEVGWIAENEIEKIPEANGP